MSIPKATDRDRADALASVHASIRRALVAVRDQAPIRDVAALHALTLCIGSGKVRAWRDEATGLLATA